MNDEWNPQDLDKDGREADHVVVDGRKVYVKARRTESGDYDTSDGHCGLCGRLTCNGRCFK